MPAALALLAVAVAAMSLASAARRVQVAVSHLEPSRPATGSPVGALEDRTEALAAAVGRHLDR
jgi:hypothetical protein